MNAKKASPNATRMLVVLMSKAPTNASVWMVTMVTEEIVKTTTSALETVATGMQYVETLKALTDVAVIPVSKEMEWRVLIMMSVKLV